MRTHWRTLSGYQPNPQQAKEEGSEGGGWGRQGFQA